MARHALEWERTVQVIAQTRASPDERRSALSVESRSLTILSLEHGQRAEVPVAWAKSLVARGAASYAR
jgi:hypothetical protein